MSKIIDKEKTFIFHSRKSEGSRRYTLIGVLVDNNLRIGYSIASDRDNFQKVLGRTIAHGRAMKKPKDTITVTGKTESEINNTFRMFAKSFPTMYKELFIKPIQQKHGRNKFK